MGTKTHTVVMTPDFESPIKLVELRRKSITKKDKKLGIFSLKINEPSPIEINEDYFKPKNTPDTPRSPGMNDTTKSLFSDFRISSTERKKLRNVRCSQIRLDNLLKSKSDDSL